MRFQIIDKVRLPHCLQRTIVPIPEKDQHGNGSGSCSGARDAGDKRPKMLTQEVPQKNGKCKAGKKLQKVYLYQSAVPAAHPRTQA